VFLIPVLKGFHILEVVLCRRFPYINGSEIPDRSMFPFYAGCNVPLFIALLRIYCFLICNFY
jgi:hypothetical protein